MHVYNRNGELKSSFNPKEGSAPNYHTIHFVSVSSNNEIALVTYNGNEVLKQFYRLSTYTQDGKFQRTVNFVQVAIGTIGTITYLTTMSPTPSLVMVETGMMTSHS